MRALRRHSQTVPAAGVQDALTMVPRPLILAGAAYISAVSSAAGFVSKPLRPLGYAMLLM